MEDLSQVLKMDTADQEAYHWRARYQHELQRYDLAIRDIYAAIALDPDNADYHKDLHQMLFFAGRYEEAFETAREFLPVAPATPDRVVTLFIVCVTGRITGQDIALFDQEFTTSLETEANLSALDIESLEAWLPRCPPAHRHYVVSLLEKYKAKSK